MFESKLQSVFTKKDVYDAYLRATKVWSDNHYELPAEVEDFRGWACPAVFLMAKNLKDEDEMFVPPMYRPILRKFLQTHICVAKCPELEDRVHCMGDGTNDEYYAEYGCCRVGNTPEWKALLPGDAVEHCDTPTTDDDILAAFNSGEWCSTQDVCRLLNITFEEGLRRFEFSRTAEWNKAPLNGQKIATQFRIKKEAE